MIDALQDAFPEASFLWLVRNGVDTVASYTRRAYREDEIELSEFSSIPKDWVRYRIQGDEVGAMTEGEWRSLDCFARNCWYWAWTNEKIRKDLQTIGARWMLVRLEDFADQAEAIASFLGVELPGKVAIPVLHITCWREVIKAKFWDHGQRASFEQFCSPMMDQLYPGWRSALEITRWINVRNELVSVLNPRYRFGRFLGKMFRRFPESVQRPFRKLLDGRRN